MKNMNGMNGMMVICGNSIEELETDLAMMKSAIASGKKMCVGGTSVADVENGMRALRQMMGDKRDNADMEEDDGTWGEWHYSEDALYHDDDDDDDDWDDDDTWDDLDDEDEEDEDEMKIVSAQSFEADYTFEKMQTAFCDRPTVGERIVAKMIEAFERELNEK